MVPRRDYSALNPRDSAKNNQTAFDVAECEFGIPPLTTGVKMAANEKPDELSLVLYLSQLYDVLQSAPSSVSGKLGTDRLSPLA